MIVAWTFGQLPRVQNQMFGDIDTCNKETSLPTTFEKREHDLLISYS